MTHVYTRWTQTAFREVAGHFICGRQLFLLNDCLGKVEGQCFSSTRLSFLIES